MVRVAKDVWETFDFNLNRAKALAVAQHYLEIVMAEGEKAIQGYVQNLLFETVGFDYAAIMKKVQGAVEKTATAEIEAHMKEHARELKAKSDRLSKAKDLDSLPAQIRKLLEPIVSLGFLSEQTLREGAVVFAVASLEAFLKDVISAEVRRRPSIVHLFPDIEKSIDLRVINRYGGKLNVARGKEVARGLDAFRTNAVKSYFKTIYGIQNVFGTSTLERDINQLLQRRHLIVHRGGIIDHEFQRNTGSTQPLGDRIHLPHPTVLRYIEQVRKLGTLVSETRVGARSS